MLMNALQIQDNLSAMQLNPLGMNMRVRPGMNLRLFFPIEAVDSQLDFVGIPVVFRIGRMIVGLVVRE